MTFLFEQEFWGRLWGYLNFLDLGISGTNNIINKIIAIKLVKSITPIIDK